MPYCVYLAILLYLGAEGKYGGPLMRASSSLHYFEYHLEGVVYVGEQRAVWKSEYEKKAHPERLILAAAICQSTTAAFKTHRKLRYMNATCSMDKAHTESNGEVFANLHMRLPLDELKSYDVDYEGTALTETISSLVVAYKPKKQFRIGSHAKAFVFKIGAAKNNGICKWLTVFLAFILVNNLLPLVF
ncbi:hypothetical protein CRM22_002541 [Opisthorchis felineus]|uniref:Uncharacterized protein n=1 Tax=Opisthorchis felineus TaxID=147828 RepID=A0A4S2M5H7_OPIFE|nr:hypothetical protein CRM22_002541 [Opisthorchis felineus]